MTPDFRTWRIYVRPGATDLRKASNGLMIMAEQVLKQNPFAPNLFLFCNGDRKLLKALYWDKNGFCLWPGHEAQLRCSAEQPGRNG